MVWRKLADSNLRKLDKPGVYSDGGGLYLRVRSGGSRQWIFIYRRGAIRREIGLGGYGQGTAPVSLKLAREKADAIRDKLARGLDPSAETKKPRVVTFKNCMDELLASKKGEWKNDKHRQQYEMTLREYAKPLHDLPVAEIALGDVKACLLPHWERAPETASRTRQRIEAVIDYGIAHGWRRDANPARWKGLLDKVLPKRRKLTRGHHAALAHAQVPSMMAALRQSSGVAARAVEFLTLTAARSGEVRGATFDEIDTEAKVWKVPAERMKAGREHVVPLCDRALQIVEAMRQRAVDGYLFPGGVERRPISETAMTKALRLASPDEAATLHGMRSTFRDWAGDETEHEREIAEMALAHAVGDEVELAYRRGTALEKRRRLMEDWSAFCDGRAA
ncbi:integrase arm-type DNA-binding domain-containing protein [Chelatococcus sambhunathii]|uniref:Integrase arm-type DNA-binding domain-containing protein n=1 Tax=Chelatococcus sambhunathii TaxID=363953 RepID=A0ABU1DFU8_9HYPH|nr:integrase arm-type DNA-binding domain-containing protein [Chelatococcus sambhunathii]MDR4306982.1 integrase arm-type DNA-binding domain-containing protein [Chelatococcus sambhunathii]